MTDEQPKPQHLLVEAGERTTCTCEIGHDHDGSGKAVAQVAG